ncbi:hypothetical protein [Methylobacterium gregans]|uniref:PAC domain-containing protein n=1 Tax=Methylobacterium gregans TaxID=374424 RepID=A0AA37M9C0_9HYPH|nr:hypothetical protein [Methylobacterium gregans]MDQ0523011.1 PAS domain-containing protein [Methylobacterium gregans]GJD77342.1 hypothetical protein NBEOAGPD_0546 [Methylobacterium gregans]GLS56337.1 hypothetical protein GCM10007886_45220 [Methylobacterium gregans]
MVSDGRATRFVGTIRDITHRMRAARAEQAVRERYRLVIRATKDAIWDRDVVSDAVA